MKALDTDSEHKEKVTKGQRLGCGAPMDFDTLPRLKNIDDIINSWYQTVSTEDIMAKVENQKDLKSIK